MNDIVDYLISKKSQIETWIEYYKSELGISRSPFYSSVDIRHAHGKLAIVDYNFFPAGFNNLCHAYFFEKIFDTLKQAFFSTYPNVKKIILYCEEHSRNTWYLENLFVLKQFFNKLGLIVCLVMPSTDGDSFYLKTAKNNELQFYSLKSCLSEHPDMDLLILNNDLSLGISEDLLSLNIPISPSPYLGWHSRLKSHYFAILNQCLEAMERDLGIDPWLLSCDFETVENVVIDNESDRLLMKDVANKLFERISKKYLQYDVKTAPFVFLKSNYGTYGMGITVVHNPDDLVTVNRKIKNKLTKGKGSRIINNFILQEGVPSMLVNNQNNVMEYCLYQMLGYTGGGFYRVNSDKGAYDNLNAKGMSFQRSCWGASLKNCAVDNCSFDESAYLECYELLSKLTLLAASKEIEITARG